MIWMSSATRLLSVAATRPHCWTFYPAAPRIIWRSADFQSRFV